MKNNNEMKLLSSHIKEFPNPYKVSALNAVAAQKIPNDLKPNTCAALKSFCWDKTPQGGSYWREFYNSIDGRIDDQI